MDKTTRDKEIRNALAADDPVAVEWLWDDYGDDLFAFLCGFLGSLPDAEDCLQQVFIKLGAVRKLITEISAQIWVGFGRDRLSETGSVAILR